ncbi:hypothetical protein H175_39p12 (plasmid) [Bacillus thuringiensis serovar thuringiensis str. IS5056]|nr:hypothetical protein H175_39p12 [Bacillus thuringiensis serovar thuringiensis str. IS5056]
MEKRREKAKPDNKCRAFVVDKWVYPQEEYYFFLNRCISRIF